MKLKLQKVNIRVNLTCYSKQQKESNEYDKRCSRHAYTRSVIESAHQRGRDVQKTIILWTRSVDGDLKKDYRIRGGKVANE